jgi:hypothetical protein
MAARLESGLHFPNLKDEGLPERSTVTAGFSLKIALQS